MMVGVRAALLVFSLLTLSACQSMGGADADLVANYGPWSANWQIEERQLGEDTYTLTMRAKNFRTGGDGESIQMLKRRALQLQRERGYAGYRILEYSEGIESRMPARRVAEGVFQLMKAPQQ